MEQENKQINFDDLISQINVLQKTKDKKNLNELKELHNIIDNYYLECKTDKEREEFAQKLKNLLLYDLLFPKLLDENFKLKEQLNNTTCIDVKDINNDELPIIKKTIGYINGIREDQPKYFEMKKQEMVKSTVYIEHIKSKIDDYILPIENMQNFIKQMSIYLIFLTVLFFANIFCVMFSNISNNITDIVWGYIIGNMIYLVLKCFKFIKERNKASPYDDKEYALIEILYAAGVPLDKLMQSDCISYFNIKKNSTFLLKIINERKKDD